MEDWGSIAVRVIPTIQKMILDAAFLNTQHYKVKWGNRGKGVALSPTPGVVAIEKRAFELPSTKGRQLITENK